VTAAQFCSSFDVAENRQRIVPTLESLAEEGVNGAVFPECALTGYQVECSTELRMSPLLKKRSARPAIITRPRSHFNSR